MSRTLGKYGKMSSDKKNSFFLALQYFISIINSFVILKLCIDSYSAKYFGVWIVFASLWGVGGSVDFGFGTAIIKFIAEARRDDDAAKMQVIFSTGLVTFLNLGTIMVTVCGLIGYLAFFTNPNIVDSSRYLEELTVFLLLGANFFLQYISGFLRSFFEGMNSFISSGRIQMINTVVIFSLVCIVLLLKLSLVFLGLAYCFSAFTLLLSYIYLFRVIDRRISLTLFAFKWEVFRHIIKYSSAVQLGTIFSVLVDPLIKYVIGNYSSLESVSFYEIARRFAIAISGLFQTTFRNLFPKVSMLTDKTKYNEFITSEVARISKIGIVYSGFVFGVGSLFLAILIKIWYGRTESILMFLILAIPESINCFGYSIYVFLMGIGKASFLALIQFINLVSVGAALWIGFVVFHSKYGLIGYTFSVTLSNILMLLFIKKHYGVVIREFAGKGELLKLILLFVALFAAAVFVREINLFTVLALLSIFSVLLFFRDFYYIFLSIKKTALGYFIPNRQQVE